MPEATAEAWSPGRLEFELLDVVLYDLDGDPTTTGDQVKATGKLGVEPTFDVDLDIAWGQIQRFQFTNATRLSATLELDGRVTVADLEREVALASVRFAPVTVFVGSPWRAERARFVDNQVRCRQGAEALRRSPMGVNL